MGPPNKADQKDPRTLFIRGVDFAIDEKKLEEVFSDIGPVRTCFLVREKGKETHKGFGFVQFALQEDAERAVQDLNNRTVGGKKLQVESAIKRAPLAERTKRKAPASDVPAEDEQAEAPSTAAAKPRPAPQRAAPPARAAAASPAAGLSAAEQKHRLVSAVALGSLTPETVQVAIGLANAAGEVTEVLNPAPPELVERSKLRADGCTGTPVVVFYANPKAASDAVAKLHGRAVKPGKKGKGGGGGREDADAPAINLWARQVSGDGAHVKRWRIIVRNLPFQVQEKALRALLQPAGFVWELTIPRGPDGRGKGFAFAAFTKKSDAEKAIALANGKVVAGRPVAVDWAVAKAQYVVTQKTEQKAGDAAAAGGEESGSGPSGDESDEGPSGSGSDEGYSDDDDGASDSGSGDDAGISGQERSMVHNVLDQLLEGGEEGGKQDGKAQHKDEKQGPSKESAKTPGTVAVVKPAVPAAGPRPLPSEVGNTVFVRGLALDTTQQELHARMSSYGPVKACRMVVDRASGKNKGTAFVEFTTSAGAGKAAEACAKARKKQGPGVVVGGRVLDVDLALSKEGAKTLGEAQAAAKQGDKDRRNLYLAKEGAIPEGSTAWQDMSEQDQAKRKRATEEKKLKLKSPNFLVSTTRLSVRNIPFNLDEKALKALFLQAVKQRATKESPMIKQVKILHDSDKTDAEGNPKSKGLGFVEFAEHQHALVALRQLNNNPAAFTKDRRPIVEFAVENAKILKKREANLEKQRRSVGAAKARAAKKQKEAGEGPAPVAAPKPQQAQGKQQDGNRKRKGDEAAAGGGSGAAGPKRRKLDAADANGKGAAVKPDRPAKADKQVKAGGKGKPQKVEPPKKPQSAQNRAVRAKADQQRVQSAQARKRQQDDDIDALAGGRLDDGGRGKQPKKARRDEAEKGDKLDSLVQSYKAKLFGGATGRATGKAGSSVAAASAGAAMKRWFE